MFVITKPNILHVKKSFITTCLIMLIISFCGSGNKDNVLVTPEKTTTVNLGYPNEPVNKFLGITWGTELNELKEIIPDLQKRSGWDYFFSLEQQEIDNMDFIIRYKFINNKLCEVILDETSGNLSLKYLVDKHGQYHNTNKRTTTFYWYGKKVDIEYIGGFEKVIKYIFKPLHHDGKKNKVILAVPND